MIHSCVCDRKRYFRSNQKTMKRRANSKTSFPSRSNIWTGRGRVFLCRRGQLRGRGLRAPVIHGFDGQKERRAHGARVCLVFSCKAVSRSVGGGGAGNGNAGSEVHARVEG